MVAEARDIIVEKREASIEIVLMEDEDIREITTALESNDCKVRLVSGREEAVALAEKGQARFFILDINMGADRFNEGLDTLEEIKKIDEDIFVAIYTRYPTEWYRRQAANLRANFFWVKTPDVNGDIARIVAKMVPYICKWRDAPYHEENQYSEEFTLNYNAFQDLVADEKLLAENFSYYVAFVGGQMVKRSKHEDELLSWLISEPTNKPKFYAFVQDPEDDTVEYLPSPLFIDDF